MATENFNKSTPETAPTTHAARQNSALDKMTRLAIRATCALGLSSVAACATEPLPPPQMTETLKKPVTVEPTGEKLKSLAELITEAHLYVLGDVLLTPGAFPAPTSVKLEHLGIITFTNTTAKPLTMGDVELKRTTKDEAPPANIYEAIIYATQNPDAQTEPYFAIQGAHETSNVVLLDESRIGSEDHVRTIAGQKGVEIEPGKSVNLLVHQE